MPPRPRSAPSSDGCPVIPTSMRSSEPPGHGTVRIPADTEATDVNEPRTLRRLFAYAREYRGRLGLAFVGMLVYAAGSAGLAALIRPIFDSALPKQEFVAFTASAIVVAYVLKGIGS